jgi:hypothetical protein
MAVLSAILWPIACGYALWYGKHVAPLTEPSAYAIGHFIGLQALMLVALLCSWIAARNAIESRRDVRG